MVVCKFFLEGRCKFGNSCNFEHTNNRYSNENSYRNQPQQQNYQQRHQSQHQSHHQPQKYFNQSNHQPQQSRQQYFNQQQPLVQPSRFGGHQPSVASAASQSIDHHEPNAESYIKLVVEDAVSAEKGGQWLFSCYAPLLRRVINKNQESSTNQNQETLPCMEDYSPEELRWSWMESQSSPGQNQEYMAKLQLLTQTHQNIRRALQNPDKPTSNYIILIERGINASTAGTAFGSSSNLQVTLPSQPSSSFSFSLPNAQMPRPSAQLFSGFQQPVAAPPATSFSFRLPSSTPAQPSGFGLLPQSQPQPFGVPTQPATTFRFAVNNSLAAIQTTPSPFQNPAVSQSLPSSAINNSDSSLSTSDLEKYNADKFIFSKIPRTPPPRNLC